jgi:general secretion pathway protein D
MISERSEGVDYRSFSGETTQPPVSATLAQAKEAAQEQNEGGAKSGSEPGRSVEDSDKVKLNFEDADLSEVIRTLASLLQINYIIDPNVKGKVTIYTAGTLSKKDLLSIFFQILQVNGLTAIKEGQLYRIVDAKDASRMPIAILKGQNQEDVPPEERTIIQIIPLKSISVQEMTKLITPFVSAAGTIVASDTTNTLMVVDKGMNIMKILKLVEVFDVDVFGEFTHSFYKVQYTDVDSLARTLTALFPPLRGAREPNVRFIALDRLNTLLTISSNPRALSKVEEFIRKLDTPSDEVAPQVYVYSVRNGVARELGMLLNSVFGQAGVGKERPPSFPPPTNPLLMGYGEKEKGEQKPEQKAEEKEKGKIEEKPGPEAIAPGSLKGRIKITADETRNALIIEATPRDYRVVLKVLERIDVLPRQVLIEVTVAEITLDKSLELGVEWSFVDAPTGMGTELLSASTGASGLRFAIGQSERWVAALHALATQGKVKILSSPSVLASDSKTAKIDISTEIPVASAQYQYPTAAVQPLLETTVQYRNTGVILNVTPHINEGGLVSMDISQEVSQPSTAVKVGQTELPSFFTRKVQTTLTVNHRQTIVIGGLIGQTGDETLSGVPCLINIPIVGWVFGNWSNTLNRTELVILITPHVVASLEDAEAVSKEFKSKLGEALKALETRPSEAPDFKSRMGIDMLPNPE